MRLLERIKKRSWVGVIGAGIVLTPVLAMSVIGVEALVRARLNDELFAAPTRFYARRFVLTPGASLDGERLETQLKRLGYQTVGRRRGVGIGEYYRGRGEWVIGRRAFRVYDRLDPGGVAVVRTGWSDRVSSVEDARGRRLRSVALEPEVLGVAAGPGGRDRIPVPLSAAPEHLVQAILTVEDRRFFDHSGLDFKRIAGAALVNARSLGVRQGGSTLTQQLAKSLFLSNSRSPIRKMRDMAMARTLERRHTKEEILQAYLNEVYLGQDGALAIHGVGRAAQFYFGKDVSQLDRGESALLAGIIRGPNLYSPFRRPDVAKERRDLVLRMMQERGLVSDATYARIVREPLGLRVRPERTRRGRYFIDYVSGRVPKSAAGGLHMRGLTVLTTLDLDLQRLAEKAVHGGLERIEANRPALTAGDTPLQAALVALDPRTGEILAMAGGRDYGTTQFNRAVYARRQTGSSFKPVVALAALSRGRGFTLASTLPDRPLAVETPLGTWRPANYDGEYRGDVSLREALERSLNVPFARLGMQVGPEHVVATARKLGIESRINAVPSLALGAFEMTPLEMTRAFAVFAANGFRPDVHAIAGVLDASGTTVSRGRLDGEQVYTPAETYLVTSALQGAVDRGTGRGLRELGYRGPVAAKSGTTNDFRDAWFIGYTPNLVVGVWVGFDDARSTNLTGSSAALPIFARFLKAALGPDGDGDFSFPTGLEIARVNSDGSYRSRVGCRGNSEVFLRGTAPLGSCSSYRYSSRSTRRSRRSRSADAPPAFANGGRLGSRRAYRP